MKEVIKNVGAIITVAIIVIFTLIIMNEVNTHVQADNTTWTNASKETISTFNTRMPTAWDWGILLLSVGLIIISVLAARNISKHPAGIVVAVLIIAFIVFFSAIMSNVYSEMKDTNTTFEGITESMPITNYILDHLVEYSLIYAFIVGIALYTKKE